MANPGTVRRINPEELASIIEQARDEQWTEFALSGPGSSLGSDDEPWPERLWGKTLFQLTQRVENLAPRLVQLTALERLIVRGLDLGDSGATAIATHLKRLTTLELWRDYLGDDGASAIASNLTQLTTLDLSVNNIGDVGAAAIASNLKRLTMLDLSVNQIGDAGASTIATHLKQLTTLQLNSNHVGDTGVGAIATHLKQLTKLNLSVNHIGAVGAAAIATNLKQLNALSLLDNHIGAAGAHAIAVSMKQLTKLYLGGDQLGDASALAFARNLTRLDALLLGDSQIGYKGAEAIATHLKQLTKLYLWGNQLGDVAAEAIATHLKCLQVLDLGGNQIGDAGARAIATNLDQLTTLSLWDNQIGDPGAEAIATNLELLTTLDLRGNRLGDAGAQAIGTRMRRLTRLDLSDNQIGDAGAQAIGMNLVDLEWLELSRNVGIQSILGISGLRAIRYLGLSKTSVSDLSPVRPLIESGIRVAREQYATGIIVHACPLLHPTPEIVRQGQEAVLNYFREMDRQGVDYLYEAKVLLVGEGGAGKTSLMRRLYYPELPLPAEDESTRGIQIHRQEFKRSDAGMFRLNLWDFGGQQIYHATHQFFLTKNSLYVLVDDTRKDHKSVRDEGFRYWLEVVEVFGARSPMLIFQNEKGGRSKKIDEAGIKGRFPNVRDIVRGDLAVAGAADGMRRAIEHFVQELPHVGEAVPAKWVLVRSAIEEVAKEKPHISLDAYFALYASVLEPDRAKALFLSRYLHDLGVFLHFQDDPRLSKTVIVQNRWATEAVFRILDDEVIKQRPGRFTRDDCRRLWASDEYAGMRHELLALMEKFELCYRLPDSRPDTWLVPQLLNPSTPSYVATWPQSQDLALSYRYEFLPRGLISRLMVRMHRFVVCPEHSWSNGALFEREQTQLLACVAERGDEIVLRAQGPESKALLSVIANALEELNDTFPGLEGKVQKWVPCRCDACRVSTAPELFEERRLQQRKRDGKLNVECPASYADVSVLELLDGLRMDQHPCWALKTIHIFLASSEELRTDRDAFDLYLRQQNDQFIKRGFYLKTMRWENFLDAMSETRLQDEYNEAVRQADLFVSLLATKTGRFTEEEFDVAYSAFKCAGKPRIYTFFKDVQVPANAESHAALTTLISFQKKLSELGHFWTKYKSAEDLNLRFREQLEKLESGWLSNAYRP